MTTTYAIYRKKRPPSKTVIAFR